MASPSIHRIERLNYGLTAIGTLIALLTQSRSITLGFAVGAALTCLNFLVLRKLIVKWTTEAAQGKSGNASLLMLPKMIAMMGLVAVAVLLLPVNVIAFAIGYSVFIASIIIETIYSSAFAADPVTPPSGDTESRENGHG